MPVPVEPVDQGPVEAGDVPDVLSDDGAQILHVPCLAEALHEGAQAKAERVEPGLDRWVGELLQFHHDEAADAMRRDLVGLECGGEGDGPQVVGPILGRLIVEIAPHDGDKFGKRGFQGRADIRPGRRIRARLHDD